MLVELKNIFGSIAHNRIKTIGTTEIQFQFLQLFDSCIGISRVEYHQGKIWLQTIAYILRYIHSLKNGD